MEKVKRTHKQRFLLFLRILLVIILIIGILCALCSIVSVVGVKSNKNFISNIDAVKYENQLEPQLDSNGYYTFVTDDNFKVMQLTDIHIGAGFLSIKKDTMALNAVASMITAEKPDLVVVTGDIAFPVPFQAGTLNNKQSAKLFAELMEQLGVYWCLAFGNHDTEAYSYFDRETISELYESEAYPHCLFQAGPEDIDGYGNYPINVKNTKGEITQSLFMLDTHSYVDGDYLGIMWKYDCIHENQVNWYKNTLETFQAENNGAMPKSLAFFHMPLQEYKDAWYEYRDNNYQDTENVQYKFGKAGETGLIVFSSEYNYGFFDTAKELGSTQGIFCGHEHLNNFSIDYKDIRLTYDYSVDYLAYAGIMNYGLQRGCTLINIMPDSSFDCVQENYYQDKYQTIKPKEEVTLESNYHSELD
ncbi:MAG: metallophosphoesterase [Clostridium sp.]|nr:metallophosphoesterase [Clostridium sp.]